MIRSLIGGGLSQGRGQEGLSGLGHCSGGLCWEVREGILSRPLLGFLPREEAPWRTQRRPQPFL